MLRIGIIDMENEMRGTILQTIIPSILNILILLHHNEQFNSQLLQVPFVYLFIYL